MIRPRTALATVLLGAVLALAPATAPVHAADPSPSPSMGTQDSPDLEQKVTEDEKREPGKKVVVSRGHIDIGPKMIDGRWTIQVRDDTVSPPVWRNLDDVVVQLVDGSQLAVPTGAEYAFLGLPDGAKAYVVPQTQNQEVIWIGWNTQDPAAVKAMGRGATLTMMRRQGPGKFSLFLQNGQVGGPQALWDGQKKEPQPLWVDVNTHTHANWVFEKPGVQLVELKFSARTADGRELADTGTLRLAVGSQTTVEQARAAAFTGPAPSAATASGTGTGSDAGRQPEGSRVTGPLLWTGLAALVLGGLVAFVTLRSRAARRAAEAQTRTTTTGAGAASEEDR